MEEWLEDMFEIHHLELSKAVQQGVESAGEKRIVPVKDQIIGYYKISSSIISSKTCKKILIISHP